MFKIAKSVEYSILALRHIALNSNGNLLTAREIAENENIPFELLAKLLQKLARGNILESAQGTRGGYFLRSSINEVHLSDIINAVDENIQITDCMVPEPTSANCSSLENCCLRAPMLKLQNRIENLMGEITLEELI